ncbi:hypothetical protein TNCV_5031131 [Trichonephila clavipes]|nr:hypothetical protein TNCV_5031131 [Trichonephila clavipes]
MNSWPRTNTTWPPRPLAYDQKCGLKAQILPKITLPISEATVALWSWSRARGQRVISSNHCVPEEPSDKKWRHFKSVKDQSPLKGCGVVVWRGPSFSDVILVT